jgi:hypothetical protein
LADQNYVQLLLLTVGANNEYDFWFKAEGKSFGCDLKYGERWDYIDR